jgi:antitoxin HicB
MLGNKVTYLPRHPATELNTKDDAHNLEGPRFNEGIAMFQYPAIFERDNKDGSYTVTFPDFGYGVTQGASIAEAQDMAADLLASLMMDCMEKRDQFPKPGKGRNKMIRQISLPALLDSKANLYTTMRAAGVRKAELARRLGCQKSQIDRLLDFKNSTRMERMEAAFRVLGKKLVIEVQDAA